MPERSNKLLDLTSTDECILELLRTGRCTPGYIASKRNCCPQHVQARLQRLVAHGYVAQIHTGLYQLVEDPERSRG